MFKVIFQTAQALAVITTALATDKRCCTIPDWNYADPIEHVISNLGNGFKPLVEAHHRHLAKLAAAISKDAVEIADQQQQQQLRLLHTNETCAWGTPLNENKDLDHIDKQNLANLLSEFNANNLANDPQQQSHPPPPPLRKTQGIGEEFNDDEMNQVNTQQYISSLASAQIAFPDRQYRRRPVVSGCERFIYYERALYERELADWLRRQRGNNPSSNESSWYEKYRRQHLGVYRAMKSQSFFWGFPTVAMRSLNRISNFDGGSDYSPRVFDATFVRPLGAGKECEVWVVCVSAETANDLSSNFSVDGIKILPGKPPLHEHPKDRMYNGGGNTPYTGPYDEGDTIDQLTAFNKSPYVVPPENKVAFVTVKLFRRAYSLAEHGNKGKKRVEFGLRKAELSFLESVRHIGEVSRRGVSLPKGLWELTELPIRRRVESYTYYSKNVAVVDTAAMDLADLAMLRQHVGKPLSENEIGCLGYSIAKEMNEFERNGQVYLDMKPANVLLFGNQPKLGDLGFVFKKRERLWVPGPGTSGFRPPEMVLAKDNSQAFASSRGSVYPFGASIFFLRFLKKPLSEEDMKEADSKIGRGKQSKIEIPIPEDPQRPVSDELLSFFKTSLALTRAGRGSLKEIMGHPFFALCPTAATEVAKRRAWYQERKREAEKELLRRQQSRPSSTVVSSPL